MTVYSDGAMRVLIVHFNTPALTAELVRELPSRSPKGRPIFVHILDNNSRQEDLDALSAGIAGLKNVTLERSDDNVGFGVGMNRLAEANIIDDRDVLWLLNSDTRVRPNCIQVLEEEIDTGRFAVLSPLIYSGHDDKSWIWYCGGSISACSLRVPHWLYGRPLSEAPDRPFETDFVTGAAPMMRASVFNAVGGFPEDYFLYWEDAHFSWQARKKGFRLGVAPTAHLWHQVGASSGCGRSQIYYFWASHNRFAFAYDMGIPVRRLLLGRGGLETLRPIIRALIVERERRIAKVGAALRGTVKGVRSVKRRTATPRTTKADH